MTQTRHVESEQQTRENLAALYRILDRYGMSDLANQEAGARIGERPDHYLVHPYGSFYDELTASSLVEIDQQGQPISPQSPWLNDGGQNLARWIFGQRQDINYFVHGHCENVMAVSATVDGLLPLSQAAIYLGHLVGYIDQVYLGSFRQGKLALAGDDFDQPFHTHGKSDSRNRPTPSFFNQGVIILIKLLNIFGILTTGTVGYCNNPQ